MKYERANPRSEIKREITRAMNGLDEVINHLVRAAAWATDGGRPEVAEYLQQMAMPLYELQKCFERFLSEVVGYKPRGEE